jgi:hypothetical protein
MLNWERIRVEVAELEPDLRASNPLILLDFHVHQAYVQRLCCSAQISQRPLTFPRKRVQGLEPWTRL